MRIVMMGTGEFAVPTYEWLTASDYQVVGLVTRPSRSSSRRRAPLVNPMLAVNESLTIPVHKPESINSGEAREMLESMSADLYVVCDYGQILSREVLQISRWGGINLHASILPKYRGAAPINWCLYHGDTETGVTVIHMSPRLDAGPCLTQRRVAIGEQETAEELEARLAKLGVDAVREAIEMLQGWDGSSPLGRSQDPQLATKAPRLKKSDGEVSWNRAAVQIYNQVRAMKPWPGTYTTWRRLPNSAAIRLILDRVAVVSPAADHGGALPGTIVGFDQNRPLVLTGDGLLRIDRLQPAGKRLMDAEEFLRGHRLDEGQRLD